MEDEKDSKNVPGEEKNDFQKGAETAKKAVNKTKQSVKKIKKIIDFLKRHPLIAKILFWVCLVIVIIVILICILYTLGLGFDDGAKQAMAGLEHSIQTMNAPTDGDASGSGSGNLNYIESGASIGGNKYILKYGNYSENEKKQKVQEMKDILAKNNIEIYSNQCLLFLYELKENGLDLSLYSKGDLEALYMFYKADIATTSIDLRSEDEIYDDNGNYNKDYLKDTIVPQYTIEEDETQFGYSKQNYNENDYSDDTVYGTVRIQRMTYDSDSVGKEEGEISYLTYKPYTEFTSLLESKSSDVLNYFTIDSEYNLIVAGWSNVETTYTFTGLEEYTSEEQQAIKSEYPEDGKEGSYNVYKCRSIPYQEYISKYSLNFEFLTSLLATTKNNQFAKEIAKIAEKSYIVITLHEEYSTTTTTTTTNYKNYEKIYATLDAEYSAKNSEQRTETETINFYEDYTNYTLFQQRFLQICREYGCNESASEVQNGSLHRLKWTVGVKNYLLQSVMSFNNNGTSHFQIQFLRITENMTDENVYNGEIKNLFLTKNRTFIKNGYPTQSINALPELSEDENGLNNSHLEALNDYTKLIEKEYTVENVTVSHNNSYKMEITEVNNWYEYYKKTYSAVESKPTGSVTPEYTDELEITEDNIGTRQITNSSEINNLDYIKEISTETKNNFVKTEIGEQDLTDITFTIEQVDENFYKYGYATVNSNSNTNTYKKGEKVTEEVQVKVQHDNDIAYLTISADALSSNNQNEDDEDKTEMIYGTSYEFTDGFLYVYDKYDTVQKTFNSIDEWTYQMLDSSGASINMTNLLKYLLFLYDGSDLGVTDYDLNLFRPENLRNLKLSGTALVEWLRSYEFNELREYRNGNKNNEQSLINRGYIRLNDEGKVEYRIYYLSVDSTLNFSYGLNLCEINSNTYKYTWNGGDTPYYKNFLEDEGYDIYALVEEYIATARANGSVSKGSAWAEADSIDRVQLKTVNDIRKKVKEEYDAAGITLERHELDALTGIRYLYGNTGYSANREAISQYKQGLITKEQLMDKFIVNGTHPFYAAADRGKPHELMFFEGIYQLSTGETINPNDYSGGALLDWDGDKYISDSYTFPVYNQYDERWGSYPFGGPIGRQTSRTISTSGCGCCSLAAVLSGYLGELITPDLLTDTLDDVYPDGSYYIPGIGSANKYYIEQDVVERYGCSTKAVYTREEALEALINGFAVIGSEDGHVLAFVPVSSEDAAQGYAFRIIDSAKGHNVLCRNFIDADNVVDGDAGIKVIVYPPGY